MITEAQILHGFIKRKNKLKINKMKKNILIFQDDKHTKTHENILKKCIKIIPFVWKINKTQYSS